MIRMRIQTFWHIQTICLHTSQVPRTFLFILRSCTVHVANINLLICPTIPTERPPQVGEVSANFLRIEGCHVVRATGPHGRYSLFSEPGAATFLFK